MKRTKQIHETLGGLISTRLGLDEGSLQSSNERPWASITFTGARHRFVFSRDRDVLETKSEGVVLENAEFDLPGHFVADIALSRAGQGELCVEALTVEAA